MKTLLPLLLMASVAYGQGKTAPQQGPPPKNLTQRADGHFTANQDPANPEKFEVYVVKGGDTLSGIAGQVLKNPRMWPQLWEQNEHIINPHWIYPNDKILIKPITPITQATPPPPPEPPAPAPVEPPAPQPRVVTVLPQAAPAPVVPKAPLVFELSKSRPVPEIKTSDLYCSGFVRKAGVPNTTKVIAKYNSDNGALASKNDYIYISQGAEDGVRAGAMFQVIRPTRHIEAAKGDTRAQRDLGMLFLDVAQVEVVTVQPDTSMARIVNSCDGVEVGDLMAPFEKLDVPSPPLRRPFSPFMTPSGGLEGSVVMTKNAMLNYGSTFKASGIIPGAATESMASVQRGIAGPGEVVYVNFGVGTGVKPGDVFLVFREIGSDTELYGNSEDAKKLAGQKNAIGELVILKFDDGVASALVTYSTVGISAGDSVVRR